MSQMPEIKPEVNKEPERDKKKAGLLARLFGGGGSGGSAGFGGLGGGGGGLSGLAGGGLLATKAGLMALILVGTTVAGGIGLVGYRMFGPGADAPSNGDNISLFAPKPKEAQNADGAAKDGTSASLSMLSQGNTTPKPADGAAGETPKDATAASATGTDAAAAAAAASNATGPLNKAGDTGNGVNKGLMKNSGKFGALTGPGGGGGSGAVASSAPQKSAVVSDAAKGSLSGNKKANGPSVSGGTNRSIAGRHFNSAMGQGFGAVRDNRGAASSAAGGATYDGAAAGGSNIGANGSPIGGAGAVGSGSAQPKSIAGPSTDANSSTNVPTPPAKEAAPWAKQLQTAEILIGIAAACLMVCSMINKPPTMFSTWIVRILGGVVALLGAIIIGIGASIASKYGQKQFGLIGLGVGGLLIALGANAMFTSDPPAANAIASSGGSSVAATVGSAMSTPVVAPPVVAPPVVAPPVVAPPVDPLPPLPPGQFYA